MPNRQTTSVQPSEAVPNSMPATGITSSCVCCRRSQWWASYREVLLSTETIATVIGLTFLGVGWVMAGLGGSIARWFYLSSALVAGFPILRGCLTSLLEGRISVEVLVALAIAAAISVGEFHAGAVVAVMLLGGGVLEQITIARARRSVASLLTHIPEKALVRRGETEVELPISELCVGDRVIVRPGERVAVDGIVARGNSAVDESPITGESVPSDKAPGGKVYAGSINQSGMLEIEAKKVGEATTLAHIQRLVEEAQASQAPVQRIADKAAKWYVPAALLLAVIVWAFTGKVVRGITVLIVFCPCALVLATPTAIVASIGRAARRLILIKGGEFAETVGQIHIVGFDKTGTLTVGRPTVSDIVQLDSVTSSELLHLAASAERYSEHPISVAIRRAAEEKQLLLAEPVGFRAIAGCGVEAHVEGKHIRVGRTDWIEEHLVQVAPEVQTRTVQLQSAGHTVLGIASDQSFAGLLAVRDVLRPRAKQAIAHLKEQSIRAVMLTGDNPRVAAAISDEAGIEETHAALLPEDKLNWVRQWQDQGKRVAFIGDGINDAPALAAADIGIAMGAAGTDLALETSDIAFLNDDLMKLPEVVALSRRTLEVIRQNIAFSVVLNLTSVLAAATGWISPIGGAILHESGAMAVIINAIRLLR